MDTSSQSSVDLSDEIIELILSRCPLESVVRFKSVSKSWQSIISNSRFSRMHRIQRSRLLEDQKTFFHWKKWEYGQHNYDYGLHLITLKDEKFRTKSESVVVLGCPASSAGKVLEPLCSCNGLILLRANSVYMLWNPLLRKRIIIPTIDRKTNPRAFPYWNTRGSHRTFHLYHDSINDDYRIVFHYGLLHYTVYSCKNGSWGEIKDFPHLDLEKCIYRIDGSCLYGMSCCKTEIISFDARDEKLHKFPLPKGVECLARVRLKAVSGRLCLYGNNDDFDLRLHLWVMEENGSFDKSWRKLINMEEAEEYGMWLKKPIYFTNKDEVLLRATIKFPDLYAHLIYNPHGNCTFKRVDNYFRLPRNFFFPYTENLDMPYSNTPSIPQ